MQKNQVYERTIAGTPNYMACELLDAWHAYQLGEEIELPKLSDVENKSVDVWSLGVILFEIIFCRTPVQRGGVTSALIPKVHEQLEELYLSLIHI